MSQPRRTFQGVETAATVSCCFNRNSYLRVVRPCVDYTVTTEPLLSHESDLLTAGRHAQGIHISNIRRQARTRSSISNSRSPHDALGCTRREANLAPIVCSPAGCTLVLVLVQAFKSIVATCGHEYAIYRQFRHRLTGTHRQVASRYPTPSVHIACMTAYDTRGYDIFRVIPVIY